MEKTIVEKISDYSLIPVITIEDQEKAISLGKALIKGGLPIAEITFRTNAAIEVIKTFSTIFPQIIVGAGTVLSIQQVSDAIKAGAKFIVSPCLDLEIIDYCISKNIPVIPGVVTPTEINMARKKGIKIVKFFPAETYGGLSAIKSISAPFKDIKFIPTGGISLDNLRSYMLNEKVLACGGTWLVKKEYLENNQFDLIEKNIHDALEIIKKIRG